MQYGYLKAKGAFTWDGSTRRYRIDDAKMEAGIRDLVHDIVLLQGNGDYAGVKAFMARYAVLDEQAEAVIGSMKDIPVDIQPAYQLGRAHVRTPVTNAHLVCRRLL